MLINRHFQTYWSPESKDVQKLHVFLNESLKNDNFAKEIGANHSGRSGSSSSSNHHHQSHQRQGQELTATMAHISFGKTSVLQQLIPFDVFGSWKNGIRTMTEKLDKELDHW